MLNKKEQSIALKYATMYMTSEMNRLRSLIIDGQEHDAFDFKKELSQIEADFNMLFNAKLFEGVDMEIISPEEKISMIEAIVISESLTGEETIDDLIEIIKATKEAKPKKSRL